MSLAKGTRTENTLCFSEHTVFQRYFKNTTCFSCFYISCMVGMVEHGTTTCDVFASRHITQCQVPLAQRRPADAGAKKTQKTFAITSTKALSTSTTVWQATLNPSELTPGAGALPQGANSASVTTTKTSPLIFV